MATPKKFFSESKEAVVEYEENDCEDAVQEALDVGIDPMIAVLDEFSAGMGKVGVLFDTW